MRAEAGQRFAQPLRALQSRKRKRQEWRVRYEEVFGGAAASACANWATRSSWLIIAQPQNGPDVTPAGASFCALRTKPPARVLPTYLPSGLRSLEGPEPEQLRPTRESLGPCERPTGLIRNRRLRCVMGKEEFPVDWHR